MDILYRYKNALSLRDEIGTCPNVKVEINVVDKILFFIAVCYVKEDDKQIMDEEIKVLCHLSILKSFFSAYSSPVMLTSRKVTKVKRFVSYFRHMNNRIAKSNLTFPLVKDTFTMFGSSKCEVLSVSNLKDDFHSLRLKGQSKKYCGILPFFISALYFF